MTCDKAMMFLFNLSGYGLLFIELAQLCSGIVGAHTLINSFIAVCFIGIARHFESKLKESLDNKTIKQ